MNSRLEKEIEKKFKVTNLAKGDLIQRLQTLGAKFVERKREKDTYFNVVGRDSLTTKECLRVRETDIFAEITYKPPTEAYQMTQGHFAKKETNVSVADGKNAIALLELIGNEILVVVDKDREYYSLDGCTIAFDVIKDAGLFVEIEVQTDNEQEALRKINAVAERLGLDESMIESLPYRDIVLDSQK